MRSILEVVLNSYSFFTIIAYFLLTVQRENIFRLWFCRQQKFFGRIKDKGKKSRRESPVIAPGSFIL